MSTPLRLDDELIRQAKVASRVGRRSTQKQVEWWAELGRIIEQQIRPADLVALAHGLAKVKIELPESSPIDPDAVFAGLDAQRASGELAGRVTSATVTYAASRSRPGMLERIGADGRRETGYFENGEFTAA